MTMDFNGADSQQDYGDLIPDKTLAKIQMHIQLPEPGNAGSMSELTKSQSSAAEMLCCEFTLLSEPMASRKFWENFMLANTSDKALNISRSTIRAMLESARGVQPTDMSEIGVRARQIQSYSDLDGLVFAVKIKIEKGKNGYGDRNRLGAVITPDKPEYQQAMSGVTIPGASPAPAQQQQQWPAANMQQPAQPQPAQQQWPSQATNQPAAAPAPPAAPRLLPIPSWAQ